MSARRASSVSWSKGMPEAVPALLTRTSTPPQASLMVAMRLSTESESRRSVGNGEDLGLGGAADVLGGGLEDVGSAGADGDAGALAGEGGGGGLADALTAAGDERDAAF